MAVKVAATFTRTFEATFAPSEAEEKKASENLRIRKKVSRIKTPPEGRRASKKATVVQDMSAFYIGR
jgi:hypothetical protein